jgi:hypothetical protein
MDEEILMLNSKLLLVLFFGFSSQAFANNVCNCKGYAGVGGPCYSGVGGDRNCPAVCK